MCKTALAKEFVKPLKLTAELLNNGEMTKREAGAINLPRLLLVSVMGSGIGPVFPP